MTSPITSTTPTARTARETRTRLTGGTTSSFRRLVRQGVDPVAASFMAGLA